MFFKWLIQAGNLKPSDMATTLNAGIGMVVVADPSKKDDLIESFKASGETVYEIGNIEKGDSPVVLDNSETAWS